MHGLKKGIARLCKLSRNLSIKLKMTPDTQLMTEIKSMFQEFKTELKTELAELKTEIKTEIAELKTELKADMSSMELRVDNIHTRLTTVEARYVIHDCHS